MGKQEKILLTGATGYVGGRVLKTLEDSGKYRIRCMARRPQYLKERVSSDTEVCAGDVLDASSLDAALENIDTAFYLIHSMGSDKDFEQLDREGAENFARSAKAQGVQKIIYLGGLGEEDEKLSPHLRSRQEVGKVLAKSGIPVIEFRASIVVGSGSLSFEMVRTLVERLPIMLTPQWVRVPAQPIAISDLLDYLVAALQYDAKGHKILEVGGADRVSYAGIMQEYAEQRGLRRILIRVPVLTPWLSSLWLGLVTPLYARVGRKLIDSIRHPTIVKDKAALREFDIRPRGVKQAIREALHEPIGEAQTRWSDAVSSAVSQKQSYGGQRVGGRLVDRREVSVEVPPAQAFRPIRRIGGQTGWYFGNSLWRLRGLIDLIAGGVGMRRGRRDSESVRVGDVLDFWRVEAFEPDRHLRLSAEMKLPGRAWLDFEVTGDQKKSTIRQLAIFEPMGLFGLLYWYGIYPLHSLIFRGMIRNLARTAEAGGK